MSWWSLRYKPVSEIGLLEGIYLTVRGVLIALIWSLAGLVSVALRVEPVILVGIGIGLLFSLVNSLQKAHAAAFPTYRPGDADDDAPDI